MRVVLECSREEVEEHMNWYNENNLDEGDEPMDFERACGYVTEIVETDLYDYLIMKVDGEEVNF